jgi:leader peptidase (prepilin peptidase)/N-methyltransferase
VGEKVFKKEALGFGDVWLLAGIGAFLGAKALLPVVLLASLQGSVLGIALLLAGRGTPGPTPGPAAAAPSPAPTPATPLAPAPPASAPIPAATSTSAETPPATEIASAPAAREDVWVPPRHALPFGPFLALGAVEWLYLAEALGRVVPALRLFR